MFTSAVGSPCWLLKLRALAHVVLLALSAAQVKSLVEVLPTEPVIAITGPVNDARWSVASAISASTVSATSIAVAARSSL